MTLPRYNELQRYWRKWPPMQILLAHYVGYKPPSSVDENEGEGEASNELDDEQMASLIEMFGPLPIRKEVMSHDGQG